MTLSKKLVRGLLGAFLTLSCTGNIAERTGGRILYSGNRHYRWNLLPGRRSSGHADQSQVGTQGQDLHGGHQLGGFWREHVKLIE